MAAALGLRSNALTSVPRKSLYKPPMTMPRPSAPRSGYTPQAQRPTRSLPWLPQLLRVALADQLRLGLCLLLLLGGGVIFALLSTYHPQDPSLNSVSTGAVTVQNVFGLFGSYSADLLMQLFGYASYGICLMLAAWAWRVMSAAALDHVRGRLLMGLLALVASGTMLQASGLFNPHVGGAAGVLMTKLLQVFVPQALAHALIAGLGFLVMLGALYMACALTLQEWNQAWRWVHVWLRWALRRLHIALRWAWGRMTHQPLHVMPDEATDNANAPPPEEAVSGKSREKAPRKAPTRKPQASRQPRLALDGTTDGFTLPPLELLARPEPSKMGRDISPDALQKNATLLEGVLGDFGIQGQITHVSPGPVVTLYELEPAPGIRAARVIALADDIARSMSVRSVRVAVVPGRNVIGIEMPNQRRETVLLRELLESTAYKDAQQALPMVLGKDIAGLPVIADLARMPHLLVAGTTGSGKSVAVNTMIMSLLYRLPPERCRFIMIDPKMLELSIYEGIPHLLAPVVTEPKKAVVALKWTVREMEDRYRAMSKLGVRNIDGYNARLQQARERGESLSRQVQTGFDPDTGKPLFEDQPLELNDLPYIVVIVDEMADLMLVAGKDIEVAVQRLAQMARAAGIHIVMATQRPSVDVITGTIKANFPTRISFQVTSKIDSRTILGEMGGEQLLGQGDMLYMAGGGRITRVHGPFVKDSEVEAIVAFLKEQGSPDYLTEVTEDTDSGMGDEASGSGEGNEVSNALYDMAVDIVQREGKASTSFLQRSLKLGYNRAATLIEQMEREGVVSSANHVGKREVFNSRRE
jgi:DNA segregation ATPase FtsK/SpoIIIE, S-DNA-T family